VIEPTADGPENAEGYQSDAVYVLSFVSQWTADSRNRFCNRYFISRPRYIPPDYDGPHYSSHLYSDGRCFGALCGSRLQRGIVVMFAIGAVMAIGYFLTVELTIVADQVSGYSDNIGNKLGALEKPSPPWLQHLKYAVGYSAPDSQGRSRPASPNVIQMTPFPQRCLRTCALLCRFSTGC
jgi:hypothetical protein